MTEAQKVVVSIDTTPVPEFKFELEIPAEFAITPDHVVALPDGHEALIFKYNFIIATIDDGARSEKEIQGWRIEFKGPKADDFLSPKSKMRFDYEVAHALKSATRELLVQRRRANPTKGSDEPTKMSVKRAY